MAQELNVDAIVEGSVLRGGNQIRVTAKLIEAATDRQLWGTSYNRDLSDFFVMLDEVARAIAAEIQVRLTPEDEARLRRARVVNPGAIDAYWQGMHHYWQWSPEGLTNALGFFQKAIDIEPDYAPAHAGLALAYVGVSGWLGLWFPTNVIQATNAAQRAIQLDPTLADAYVARGYAKMNYNWDWAGAEEDFLKAINLSLRPSLALDAYNNWLVPQGRLVEAVAVLTNALALDPLSPALHHDLGWTYWVAGQFTQAMWHCSMALKLDTNFYQSLRIIGWCYLATGRTNEALHAFMTNVQQVPDSQPDQAALGYAYGVTGRRPEAMQVLADLKELRQKRYVSRLRPALVHLGLGQTNEALKRLEEAYEERDGWISTMVTLPPLAPLRNERRFQELLKKLGHEELMKKLRHEK
jgi:tetratricopeptide (TPR) repeat protein